ncbi:MAG: DUF4148 domain-containing protein [Methylibium sp.]|uniref:DUF4148 domain-containing protein n=1 Tax=Methylibium sp. TaxID=2067992 RepID=UPI0017C9C7F8|nr:DUF4148 domain-containing protein [Methylibium sp.]MBA2723333.1 DUF4148 domain-containing protein [Methylibium sp.]MBA3588382.1 DUF4148 domain-containing protein [Methylibium sp.]
MKTSHTLALLLSATLAAACSAAQANDDGTPVESFDYTVSKTRAEVIADTQIWRESGLAAVQSSESPNFMSHDYQQAQQRYERMHASPQFDALVERIARERGESFRAATR